MSEIKHIPVLLNESIELLDIQSSDKVVDGTFGGGGHSNIIFQKVKDRGVLICNDLDEKAKLRFENLFQENNKNVFFTHFNFKDANQILESVGFTSINKVLLDLGTSTFQLLEDDRGFSFNSDTPLQMSFSEKGSHTGINAHTIVNSWKEESIADIIYAYGGDRNSRKIARAIVEVRVKSEIKTSKQLADIITKIIPKYSRTHPATKTFQALRIAVNDELNTLTEALNAWWTLLERDGRFAVITFHSLEDKIVKNWMKGKTDERVITKKPTPPSREEQKHNPKSRSAKLRVIQKIK